MLGCVKSKVSQALSKFERHVGTGAQDVQSLLGQEIRPGDDAETQVKRHNSISHLPVT